MTAQAPLLSFWPLNRNVSVETRSATTRVREFELDAIERFFVVDDRSAVRSFVIQRPFLVPLLFEAYQEISLYFGNASLQLKLITDPEDDSRRLTVTIMTSLSPDDAVERLQQLDEQWWLDALGRTRGALSISISADEL